MLSVSDLVAEKTVLADGERALLMASLDGIQGSVPAEAAWAMLEILGGREALLRARIREMSLHFTEDGGLNNGSENETEIVTCRKHPY